MKLFNIDFTKVWKGTVESLNLNFTKIEQQVTTLEKAAVKFYGHHISADNLAAAYPTAVAGAYAWVGIATPYAVYGWDTTTQAWADTGGTYSPTFTAMNTNTGIYQADGKIYAIIASESAIVDISIKAGKVIISESL